MGRNSGGGGRGGGGRGGGGGYSASDARSFVSSISDGTGWSQQTKDRLAKAMQTTYSVARQNAISRNLPMTDRDGIRRAMAFQTMRAMGFADRRASFNFISTSSLNALGAELGDRLIIDVLRNRKP